MPKLSYASMLDAGDVYRIDGDEQWVEVDHVYFDREGDLWIVHSDGDKASFDESMGVEVPTEDDYDEDGDLTLGIRGSDES